MDPITRQAQNGRLQLLLLFATALGMSLYIIVSYNLQIGHDKLLMQTGRTLCTLVLMVLTYFAYKWAKWLLCFVYVLGAGMIWIKLNAAQPMQADPTQLAMLVFYIFLPFWLQFSPAITAFLKYQHDRYR